MRHTFQFPPRMILVLLLAIGLIACSTAPSPPGASEATSAEPTPTPTELSPTNPPAEAEATPSPTATLPPTPTPISVDTLVDLESIEALQAAFNANAGKPRLVLLLAMGCPSCLAGAQWLEEGILAQDPDLELQVYTIWFDTVPRDMLPQNDRWDETLLDDPRVIHFWDAPREASQWFAANVEFEGPERSSLERTYGGLRWGTHIWDTYFLYGPEVVWEETLPAPLSAGHPIIQHRQALRAVLVPTLPAVAAEATGVAVYEIVPSESLVTYQVGETFAGRDFNLAVGVTSQVSGEVLVNFEEPSASEVSPIAVNIQSFRSDNFLRDERIQQAFLESAKYPLATFTPTELRGLPEDVSPDERLTFEIEGDLEVRETAMPTTFAVEVWLEDGRLRGIATTQVLMTDFGFDPPAIADLIKARNEVALIFEFVAEPVTP